MTKLKWVMLHQLVCVLYYIVFGDFEADLLLASLRGKEIVVVMWNGLFSCVFKDISGFIFGGLRKFWVGEPELSELQGFLLLRPTMGEEIMGSLQSIE